MKLLHPLQDLYNNGKTLAVLKFTEGIRSNDPTELNVLRVVKWSHWCDIHQHTIYQHIALCKSEGHDYTDVVGPGVYLGVYAGKQRGVIFGHMSLEAHAAFEQDMDNETALPCGCKLKRLADDEVPQLIDGKGFSCGHVIGHLVDDR